MVETNQNTPLLWKTQDQLKSEIEIIVHDIAQNAHFNFTKNLFENLPTLSLENVRLSHLLISHFLKSYELPEYQFFRQNMGKLKELWNPFELLIRIEKGAVLSFAEQNTFIRLIEILFSTSDDFHHPHPLSVVTHLNSNKRSFSFMNEFRRMIDTEGNLDPFKHPELKHIHEQILNIEEKCRKRINELQRDPLFSDALQYNGFDIVNDHYVIPIRTDSYNSQMGLIISRSESGHTLNIEPFEIRDLSVQRLHLISSFQKILFELERLYSEKLLSTLPLLKMAVKACFDLDFLHAQSAYCLQREFSKPIIRENEGFKFEQIFHPLIKNPIPNDVELSPEVYALIISGPNTGGKTALLKAIALSYQFFYWGMYLPCRHAEIYPYELIHFAATDLQNIAQGLSSFSGEVKNYLELIPLLKEKNLIIVDEIFNSTSSDEASALAYSLIINLNKSFKTHFIVSTHHGLLKQLTLSAPHFSIGSMSFDLKLMKPTYHFLAGIPGQSMALDIFNILSPDKKFSERIIVDAEDKLNSSYLENEKIISELGKRSEIILQKEIALNVKEKEITQKEKSLDGLLFLKKQDEYNKLKETLEKYESKAVSLLQRVQDGDITKLKKINDEFLTLRSELQLSPLETPKPNLKNPTTIPIPHLKIGSPYFCYFLNKEVVLNSIDWKKKSAKVGVGVLNWEVPLESFGKSGNTQKNKVHISIEKSESPHFLIDVRGFRLEEFQHLIEKQLSYLLAGDLNQFTVIHGHGDGVLKSWLRLMIKQSQEYSWRVPENGNDGETEIFLKS